MTDAGGTVSRDDRTAWHDRRERSASALFSVAVYSASQPASFFRRAAVNGEQGISGLRARVATDGFPIEVELGLDRSRCRQRSQIRAESEMS